MRAVVITDGKYRSALAAARAFAQAGCRVLVTQTRNDANGTPPVFSSVRAEGRWIEGSAKDTDYVNRLCKFLEPLDRPILFCVGADTLNAVAAHREQVERVARFLIAPRQVLDALNDKEQVHRRAEALGLPVPRQYDGAPETYPVVIKPRCGEKQGLKAADRYAIANNAAEFSRIYKKMQEYDPAPLIQERIQGPGRGVSVLMGPEGRPVRVFCHRRVREYPYSGGPSTCCVTEYDPNLVDMACRLLRSYGFTGLAMVEFKGDRILEVNPRIWGSFPLAIRAGSTICQAYAALCEGEPVEPVIPDVEPGIKGRFLFNDLAATADLLRHGRLPAALGGLRDLFLVPEGLKDPKDKAAYRAYLRSYLKRQ